MLANVTKNEMKEFPKEEITKALEKPEEKENLSEETVVASTVESPNYDLTKFELKRVLQNNTVRKSIALLGTFPDISEKDEAIILFEKQAFKECEVQTPNSAKKLNSPVDQDGESSKLSYFNDELKVQTQFINNIYGSFQCIPRAELNGLKTTVVYPATDKHIDKYCIRQKFLIRETPTLYENVTLPYLKSNQFSLEWVYNILEHKQEADRIVYEDTDPDNGFILLPDLKWNGSVETLYLLAIVHKHGIKSLRDLTGEHLPLLRNIRIRAAKAIEDRYGLGSSQLRMYFHYQPSFYHLHIHINQVGLDAPGIWCEKSHMLDTVINNLELMPEYYKRATISFLLYDSDKSLELYERETGFRKRKKSDSQEDNMEIEAKRVAVST